MTGIDYLLTKKQNDWVVEENLNSIFQCEFQNNLKSIKYIWVVEMVTRNIPESRKIEAYSPSLLGLELFLSPAGPSPYAGVVTFFHS